MTKKRKAKVRRSKAAEGTRGGVEGHAADNRGRLQPEKALAGRSRRVGLDGDPPAQQPLAGIKPGPRAPSPLDELLSDLHLRAPVAREPWMSSVEKAVTKFRDELNECERFETMNSEVRSPLCN